MVAIYVDTPTYGEILVKDVIIDVNGNLEGGIDVYDDCGDWWFEVVGVSTDDVEGNPEYLEDLIDANAF